LVDVIFESKFVNHFLFDICLTFSRLTLTEIVSVDVEHNYLS